MVLLNLARAWVTQLIPHCLSKVSRVGYGLLDVAAHPETDAAKNGRDVLVCAEGKDAEGNPETASRRFLAVPFLGKDAPSKSSEFSHPDLRIGLTILSYLQEGLRPADMRYLAQCIKKNFTAQDGPPKEREEYTIWEGWVNAANLRASSAYKDAQRRARKAAAVAAATHQTLHRRERELLRLQAFGEKLVHAQRGKGHRARGPS
jgi:hypothetical protein